MKGKIGAAAGLDAKIDDTPQKLKNIPDGSGLLPGPGEAEAQGVHVMGADSLRGAGRQGPVNDSCGGFRQ